MTHDFISDDMYMLVAMHESHFALLSAVHQLKKMKNNIQIVFADIAHTATFINVWIRERSQLSACKNQHEHTL